MEQETTASDAGRLVTTRRGPDGVRFAGDGGAPPDRLGPGPAVIPRDIRPPRGIEASRGTRASLRGLGPTAPLTLRPKRPSAGTRPAQRVHPRAVKVGARHGIAVDASAPVHLDEVLRRGDLVVTVCDSAHETYPSEGRPALHWSVPDPAAVDTDRAFESAFADLQRRVDRLAPALR